MSQSNAYSDLRVFGEITTGALTVFGEYSFPMTDGLANQIIVTDGAGNLSFQDANTVALTSSSIINGTGISWTITSPTTIQGNVTLAPFSTTNLAEGNNLYYTDERVDDRVSSLIINGTGITKVYNDALNTLTLGVTLAPFSTTNLTEGANLYYTDERVEDRMAAVLYKGGRGTGPDAVTWTHVDGLDRIYPTVSLTPFSTDDLAEGTTNLYLTENSLYDLMDQIIQDSASVTWTRNNVTNRLTPTASTSVVEIQLDGVSIATNPTIDFISNPNISYIINDDIINGKTTVEVDYVGGTAVVIEGFGSGSTVRTDNSNNSLGAFSTVTGGYGNTASAEYSTVAGGSCNTADGVSGSIISLSSSTITSPIADGTYSGLTTGGSGSGAEIIVLIESNTVLELEVIIGGSGYAVGDVITLTCGSPGSLDVTVGAVSSGGSAILGGTMNFADGVNSVLVGGYQNSIYGANAATIGGGMCNYIDVGSAGSVIGGGIRNATYSCTLTSTIGGGYQNSVVNGINSTIGGGVRNTTSDYNSTIGGGYCNLACAQGSSILGGHLNCIGSSADFSTINGGRTNTISGPYSTIGGGDCNSTLGGCSSKNTVSGGCYNFASDIASTIGGGQDNTVSADFSTVGGGRSGSATGFYSTLGGGGFNTASCARSTVSGGYLNVASAVGSTVSGGYCNYAAGSYSTVIGGIGNCVSHGFSSAVGCNIISVCNNTLHVNCLNLYDTPINSITDNAFLVRRSDGMVAYRAYGGLFAQTANGTPVTATVAETSILGTGVGSLIVPANGFSVGDSFVLHLSGTMSALNNDTLTIRLKSGSVILASSGAITLPSVTSKKWNLEAYFTIRAIGAAGVAQLMTSGTFTYNQNTGNSLEGADFETLNTTTFDTTGSNTLSVTVQWSSTSATNSIVSSMGVLRKVF